MVTEIFLIDGNRKENVSCKRTEIYVLIIALTVIRYLPLSTFINFPCKIFVRRKASYEINCYFYILSLKFLIMKNSGKSRRDFIKKTALTAVSVGIFKQLDAENFKPQTNFESDFISTEDGAFILPPLNYDYAALEPYIDTLTMQIHHDKHHAGYVTKLNDALAKAPELKGKSLQDLLTHISEMPEAVRTAVRNNGGGHWNHSFFWEMMSPKAASSSMSDKLKSAIKAKWNDLDTLKSEFNKSAGSLFGSGWAWIVKDNDAKLSIITTANQDNPLMDVSAQRGKPILGVDVWEHAYYIKHQNKRAEYLADIWNVIDWNKVSAWYEEK